MAGTKLLEQTLVNFCDKHIAPGMTYCHRIPLVYTGYTFVYQDNTDCSGCASFIDVYMNDETKKYMVKRNIGIGGHCPETVKNISIIGVVDYLMENYCDPNTTADVMLLINFDNVKSEVLSPRRVSARNRDRKNVPVFSLCDDSNTEVIKALK
jgi:hypothetical protein